MSANFLPSRVHLQLVTLLHPSLCLSLRKDANLCTTIRLLHLYVGLALEGLVDRRGRTLVSGCLGHFVVSRYSRLQ